MGNLASLALGFGRGSGPSLYIGAQKLCDDAQNVNFFEVFFGCGGELEIKMHYTRIAAIGTNLGAGEGD
ncbi:MAG TPA: hypothetical protein VLT36_01930 [Candidatus Dormibacteraeota bacterium]|nr:hypothetical protein [Candidatus Dormibacteraeota bacterium]